MKEEFLIEEYKHLRQEVILSFQRIDASERNALLSSGAIWAWLATHQQTVSYELIVWAPLFISVMFSLKAIALRYGVHRIGKYIERIEEKISLGDGLGWQQSNKMIPKGFPIGIGGWPFVYWSATILANAIAAYMLPKLNVT